MLSIKWCNNISIEYILQANAYNFSAISHDGTVNEHISLNSPPFLPYLCRAVVMAIPFSSCPVAEHMFPTSQTSQHPLSTRANNIRGDAINLNDDSPFAYLVSRMALGKGYHCRWIDVKVTVRCERLHPIWSANFMWWLLQIGLQWLWFD